MIISIDKNHGIFKSEEYLKDIVAFNLMEIIRLYPMLLVSNEKDFAVAMSSPQWPAWVWTSDSIAEGSVAELRQYIFNRYRDSKSAGFVAKPEMADVLAEPFKERFGAAEKRVSMMGFENPKVIPPRNKGVSIERPTAHDVEDIAFCLAEFERDCYGRVIDPGSKTEEAKKKLDNLYFFVIRQDNSVVATAQGERETDNHIAINQVYTRPEYRGRGFASALVAYISDLIIKTGKKPVLYTDLSNPCSNKAYKNVGFIERGRVDEVTLTWK